MESSENTAIEPEGIFQLRALKPEDGEDELREVIHLREKQEVVMGRNRMTNIRNLALSRRQVKLIARSKNSVEATQLSQLQPSYVNGQALLFPWSILLEEGSTLSLLKGKFEYVLERVEKKDTSKTPARSKRAANEAFEIQTPASPPVDPKPKRARVSTRTPCVLSPAELVDSLMAFGSGKPVKTKPRPSKSDLRGADSGRKPTGSAAKGLKISEEDSG